MSLSKNNKNNKTESPREMTKAELREILEYYYTDMKDAHTDLINPLTNSLPTLESNACNLGQIPANNKFTQKKCNVAKQYPPFPKTKNEEQKNLQLLQGNVIAQGAHGKIIASTLKLTNGEERIITKVPLDFDKDILRELFVQMVIINPAIVTMNADLAKFVPSYGFVVMSSPEDDQPEDEQSPYMYLIQPYISGDTYITLNKYLERFGATLNKDKLFSIVSKLMHTLAFLQEGTFKLTHGDLHGDNILINPLDDTMYIIDWGLASFTYNGKRYRNFLEEQCNIKVVSGAYDLYLVLISIEFALRPVNPELSRECKKMRMFFCQNMLPRLDEILAAFVGVKNRFDRVPHLYYILRDMDDAINTIGRLVYYGNFNTWLAQYTYKYIYDHLNELLTTIVRYVEEGGARGHRTSRKTRKTRKTQKRRQRK